MKILTNAHLLLMLTSLFWAFNTIAGRAAVGEVSSIDSKCEMVFCFNYPYHNMQKRITKNLVYTKFTVKMACDYGFIWIYWFQFFLLYCCS